MRESAPLKKKQNKLAFALYNCGQWTNAVTFKIELFGHYFLFWRSVMYSFCYESFVIYCICYCKKTQLLALFAG